jgi:hypothetical protein
MVGFFHGFADQLWLARLLPSDTLDRVSLLASNDMPMNDYWEGGAEL